MRERICINWSRWFSLLWFQIQWGRIEGLRQKLKLDVQIIHFFIETRLSILFTEHCFFTGLNLLFLVLFSRSFIHITLNYFLFIPCLIVQLLMSWNLKRFFFSHFLFDIILNLMHYLRILYFNRVSLLLETVF